MRRTRESEREPRGPAGFSRSPVGDDSGTAEPAWFKITGRTSIGTYRWTYSGVEQQPIYNGWENRTNGRTLDNSLLNGTETNNDGTGEQGDGVDVDGADYPAGFAPVPIGIGAVVKAYPVEVVDPAGELILQWWFTAAVNNHDGTCT